MKTPRPKQQYAKSILSEPQFMFKPVNQEKKEVSNNIFFKY